MLDICGTVLVALASCRAAISLNAVWTLVCHGLPAVRYIRNIDFFIWLISRMDKLVNYVILELYPISVVKRLTTHLRLDDIAVGRDAAGQPDVAADSRSTTNRYATEYGCTGVDHDVVFDDRMTWLAFDEGAVFIDRKSAWRRASPLDRACTRSPMTAVSPMTTPVP